MGDEVSLYFRCENCGGTEFEVRHTFAGTKLFTVSLACDCGGGRDRLAAQRVFRVAKIYEESGPLDVDHHWKFEPPAEIDEEPQEEIENETYCSHCTSEAAPADWDKPDPIDAESGSEEWYVRCVGCGKEIDFGWSHPERGGRIWPAECSNFNPWKSWPEPRYRATWRERGWLRPNGTS